MANYMNLKLLKQCIEFGLFNDARYLLEQHNGVIIEQDCKSSELPLLVMCTLVNDSNVSFNLCSILIEKGYKVNCSDANGLCALTYAVIFERVNLIKLFLNTYDCCNLKTCLDCYKNTLLHYIYAVNNPEIIEIFIDFYSRYYDCSRNLFATLVNSDGLSVLDLYNNSKTSSHRPTSSQYSFNSNISTARLEHIRGFLKNSNPIFITGYIKKFYNSTLTTKTFAKYEKNFDLKKFNTNVLYRIKLFERGPIINQMSVVPDFKKISSTAATPLVTAVLPKTDQLQLSAKSYKGWKNQITRLFRDYETIHSPSYRSGSLILDSYSSSYGDQQSTRNSKSIEDLQSMVTGTVRASNYSPSNYSALERQQKSSPIMNPTSAVAKLRKATSRMS